MYNLDGKQFAGVINTASGEVDQRTQFTYHQNANIVWAEYSGGEVLKGQLVAKIRENGLLDMHYQHINTSGKIMTGKCTSEVEKLADGRLKLKKRWQWLCPPYSAGYSEVIEVQ